MMSPFWTDAIYGEDCCKAWAGNAVDVTNASHTNFVGADFLRGAGTDPDFMPAASSRYTATSVPTRGLIARIRARWMHVQPGRISSPAFRNAGATNITRKMLPGCLLPGHSRSHRPWRT